MPTNTDYKNVFIFDGRELPGNNPNKDLTQVLLDKIEKLEKRVEELEKKVG